MATNVFIATEHNHFCGNILWLFIIILPQQQSLYILNDSSTAYLTAYSNNVCQPHHHHVTIATEQVNMFSVSTPDMTKSCIGNRIRKDHISTNINHHHHQFVLSESVEELQKEQSLDQSLPTGQTAGGGAYLQLSTHIGGGPSVMTDSQRTGQGLH